MQKKHSKKNIIFFLLSCLSVLAMHCRFELFDGGFPENKLLNALNKMYNTFHTVDYTDLLVLFAVFILLKYVWEKDERISKGTLTLSFLLTVLLNVSISFQKYNSTIVLWGNAYQLLITVLCILGLTTVLYCVLRCVQFIFEKDILQENIKGKINWHKYFFPIGFGIIFLGWLPWIILNYPGTDCPDSILQLQYFLGDASWSAGHPPLSTVIMGGLFSLGNWMVDANFGMFLYCLFHTCVGAWIFSLSMTKLFHLGLSLKWCMVGNFYFAFTPLWGTYAQWFEKDLLYAEFAVLQTICMLEIIVKKQCTKKDIVFLLLSGLITTFLRNNGIYAIIPALLMLAVYLKKKDRIRIAAVMLIIFVSYQGITNGLYPALGISAAGPGEALSIPFQQTARYVCEHTDDVTEYEREVIDREFGWETMFGYDPIYPDAMKNAYQAINPSEYLKIWFQMFFKHPGTYFAAFFNKSYGYLAPVTYHIEAWIQDEYYEYTQELGIYHALGQTCSYFLQGVWNLGMRLPLIKYLGSPGLYTWVVIVLSTMLLKRRNFSSLILFIPSYINILVCLASPLSDAIRYELPTVASVPLLIGWTYFSMKQSKKIAEEIAEPKRNA